MVHSRIKCAFRLSGFSCDPDEITKALGLLPTESWSVGDIVSGTSLKRQTNGWEVSTRLPDNRDLSDQIDDIIIRLGPFRQAIKALRYGGSAVMSCAMYIGGEERGGRVYRDSVSPPLSGIPAG